MSTIPTNDGYIIKSVNLENRGVNAGTLDFGPGKWVKVQVKINGTYETMFGQPSQKFFIDAIVDGKSIHHYEKDLYGTDEFFSEINCKGFCDLKVTAKLISVHGAGRYASGNVQAIAYYFGEKPAVNSENEDDQ